MSVANTRQLDPRMYSSGPMGHTDGNGAAHATVRHDPGSVAAQWQLASRLARSEGAIGTTRARPDAVEVERAREAARRSEIIRRRDNGESLARLAKRFRSTPARISRIVSQEQFKRVVELQLDYIPNDRFKRMSANQQRSCLAPARKSAADEGRGRAGRIAAVPGEHVRDSAA